jgi:hypothetical protein
MSIKIGKIVCSTIACLLLSSASFAGVLKPEVISDIRTTEANSGVLELGEKRMEYSISYESRASGSNASLVDAYSVTYLQNMMSDVWVVMGDFLRERAIPASDCRPDYNLNFFIISSNEMLKEDRFAPFFRANNLRPSLVYAFYDTTPAVYADSAIILTNFSQSQNKASVSHELAHYWWDRLCIANHYDLSGEAFALEFEAYFKRNR